jgi:DNA (cytosine-5)-methyltransferase 1
MMRYLSLFSGMEAARLAWMPLGWTCVGVAEIEPAACAVLAYHLPRVPNLGSVSEISDEQVAALGQFDVLIGGSPCQDLSVAGRRAGLAGARSSLFHHQMRIFNAARHFCGTRWLQGVPDDRALTPNAKGKPMADGQRYKLRGNSLAVPVVRWIGTNIAAAHRMSEAT